MAHGKTPAELRRSLSGVPIRSLVVRVTKVHLWKSQTGRTQKGKGQNLIKKRENDVVLKSSFIRRRSREEQGGERRHGLFSWKQKLPKKNERLHHRGADWSVRIWTAGQNNNTSYKHMRACVPGEPGTLRRVILSNNVFSSVAASWVAWLALWPGTALKTTIMIVASWCLGTASASPDGGGEFSVTDRLVSPVLYRHTKRRKSVSHNLIWETKICESSKVCWHF